MATPFAEYCVGSFFSRFTAQLARFIGYMEPYATSHEALDRDAALQEETRQAARALLLTAKALLDKNPHPTDAQIRDAMKGVLCRCMTYYGINAAVKRAAREIA